MNFPILKQLDVLIGLAVVMLIASTVVTAITQLLLNTLRLRTARFQEGLAQLIKNLSRDITRDEAEKIAAALLSHPLVKGPQSKLRSLRGTKAEILPREEIVICLLDWASGASGYDTGESERLRKTLLDVIVSNGITDPEVASRAIRHHMMRNERESPQLPAHVWRSRAVMEGAASDFSAKIFAWYDNTMDRVSEAYSVSAKFFASIVALGLAFAIQLDSVDLLRRLSRDDRFRDALVAKAEVAKKMHERGEMKKEEAEAAIQASLEELRDPKASVISGRFMWDSVALLDVKPDDIAEAVKYEIRVGDAKFPFEIKHARSLDHLVDGVGKSGAPLTASLRECSVRLTANDPGVAEFRLFRCDRDVRASWRAFDISGICRRTPGVLLSWILLTLGAPFWYDILKKALGFRSLLASKDEKDRQTRQADQRTSAELSGLAAANSQIPASSNFDLTVQGTPDAVVLSNETKFYAGEPSRKAVVVDVMPEDCAINVVGWVRGEVVPTATGPNNDKWYKTSNGEYFWSGDTHQ